MSYLKELASTISPLFDKDVDQNIGLWLQENISLKNTIEGKDGLKYPNFEDSPDFMQIFEDIQNPDVKEICLMTSAQRGKTFFIICVFLWWVKVKGYVVMLALCDLNKKNKVRERVKKILKANKEFLGWDDSRGATVGDSFVFDNGAEWHWGILSSPATIAETPCDCYGADEYDEYIASHKKSILSARKQLSRRGQGKKHAKGIYGSTPKVLKDRGGILDVYSSMKRHVDTMECPHCKEYVELKHEDLKTREFPDDDIGVIKTKGLGYAICPSCEAEILDSDHYEMSRKPKFQVVEDDKGKSDVFKSYHSSVCNSTTKNFSDIALEWHSCLLGGPVEIAEYHNSVWANPQMMNNNANKDKEFTTLDYTRGTAPPDCQFLVVGADLGNHRLHTQVIGFGLKGRSFLVDWDERNYGGRENFPEIKGMLQEFLLDKDYRTTDGKPLKVLYIAIDSNHYTADVLRLCEQMPQLIPVVGSGQLKTKFRKVPVDPKNKFDFKNSLMERFELGHNYIQDDFEARLSRSYEEGSCFCLPRDVYGSVKEHYNNMILEFKPDGVTTQWVQRGRMKAVDWRDCAIYALSLFDFMALKNQLRVNTPAKLPTPKRQGGLTSSMY